jgi:hypothetical protein
MAKYSKKRVAHICSLISKDSHTIAEICSLSGISEETFYTWKESKPEFLEAIEKAQEKFDKMVVAEAKKSMVKKITGYTVQEKKTVYTEGKPDAEGKAKPKIKEQTIIDKHFQPDTGMIIFALCNKDSENFKNRQTNELTGNGGKPLFPSIKIEIIDSADQVIKDDSGS